MKNIIVGYNKSHKHEGSLTHYEKPRRIHYCVDIIKKILGKKIFVKNIASKDECLQMIRKTHNNEYINELLKVVPQYFLCKFCMNKMKNDNFKLDEIPLNFEKCGKCQEKISSDGIFCYLDIDTYFTNYTFDIVLDGIGIIKSLIDIIHNNDNNCNDINHKLNGFALIRPPGHHCGNTATGFCIVNNVVIASKYAQTKGYNKIFILDIDFHHGNGTAELLKSSSNCNIYMCSIHGYGNNIYPGTGSNEENTNNVLNIPLDVTIDPSSREYINDDYYLNIINGQVMDFIKKINPNMLIISCGFDGHQNDPLEGFFLTDNAYVRIVKVLKLLKIPLLFITEGGYSINDIAQTTVKMLIELDL